VCVSIHGDHSCMTARGIAKLGARTTTVTYQGTAFDGDSELKKEFMSLMK